MPSPADRVREIEKARAHSRRADHILKPTLTVSSVSRRSMEAYVIFQIHEHQMNFNDTLEIRVPYERDNPTMQELESLGYEYLTLLLEPILDQLRKRT